MGWASWNDRHEPTGPTAEESAARQKKIDSCWHDWEDNKCFNPSFSTCKKCGATRVRKNNLLGTWSKPS